VITPVARVDVNADAGLVVEADPAQLRQIVMNLVTNASDSLGGAPGTITVSVSAETLDRGRLDRTDYGHELPPGRYARIEVADTGCGMDPDTLRRMFEPFFTTKFTGRGLGLAALIGILRNHRGTVDVESSLGRGTTVRVWLPLLEDAVADRSETSSDAPSVTRTGTILLAEDEDIVRRVTTRMLSKLGFDVIAVRDGGEALSAIDIEDLTLALVDVQMPALDGREVLKAVRKRRPELRVVLMTGYAGPDAEAVEPAPDAWLRKPFSLRDLVAAVELARTKAPGASPKKPLSPRSGP
jgi:CheY-like chemotaxis protein